MSQRHTIGIVLGTAALASVLALVAERVRAAGIPAKGALTYTGALANPDGTPITAPSKQIGLFTYDAQTAGTIVQDCTVLSSTVSLTGGQFQILLPDACSAQMKAISDLWLEVQVDGTSLGRTKLGAVPYAVEAGHAVSADLATNATNASSAVGTLATQLDQLAAKSDLPVISVWKPYPAKMQTQTGATVAEVTCTGMYRRVGDSLESTITTRFTGAPAAAGTLYQWTLPQGLQIDTSKLTSPQQTVGTGVAWGPANPTQVLLLTYARSATTVSGGGGNFWYINESTPLTFASGFGIELNFTVPIVGWSAAD